MSLSIHKALLAAFVGLVVLLTGLLVGFSLAREAHLVRALATPIVELNQERAREQVHALVRPIRRELAESLSLIRRGQLDLADPDSVRARVLAGFQELAGVGSMMVGDEAGYQLLIMRYDDQVTYSPLLAGVSELPSAGTDDCRFVTREFDRNQWGDRSYWTLWEEDGEQVVARWEVDLPGYDVTLRPWHLEALERLRDSEARGGVAELQDLIAWTDVYTLFTSKTPGISASLASRDRKGNAVIVAYDLLLADLTAFTSSQHPTVHGLVFLCDREGRTVALPQDPSAGGAGPDLARLLEPIEQIGAEGLAGWADHLRSSEGGTEGTFRYESDGEG